MSRFKIGQRVVCIESTRRNTVTKGNEYIIDGFYCCERCGVNMVYISGINRIDEQIHVECGHGSKGRINFIESRFAPIQSFGEQIEEQLSKEANEVSDWIIEAIQPKP